MEPLLTVSPSPHVHTGLTVPRVMQIVIIAMVPALLVSVYAFGISALLVTGISVLSCVGFEYLIARYLLKSPGTLSDGSAIVTGILLAFNVPSNLPWYLVVIGSVVAMGVGKMSFGGLGNNPFNPALVGRVFLLLSFPVQMTTWPVPGFTFSLDATTGATPLGIIKDGIRSGESLASLMQQIPSYTNFVIGFQGGSLGEVSALALVIGLVIMLYKKIITWHIPVTLVLTVFAMTGIFWLIDSARYADPVFHILTGGVLLGAIFMATDYVTSPVTYSGMVVFAIGIGVITVLIRLFGGYPEGISFAILIMNGFTPVINRYFKPAPFGNKP